MSVVDFYRLGRCGRYVPGSKAPGRLTKSFKRNCHSGRISQQSHNSTCHKVRSSRPSGRKFLALSPDELTLSHAELRSNEKSRLCWTDTPPRGAVTAYFGPVTANFGRVTEQF